MLKIVKSLVGEQYTVMAQGVPYIKDAPGVCCTNPEKPEEERIYTKTFKQLKIYLPHQYELAVRENLVGRDVVVIGMNGYSMLSEAQCKAWGVRPGAYEAACKNILLNQVSNMRKKFPGIDIRLVHGSSDLSVDKAIIEVANKSNLPQLGHSCLEYLFWVKDQDMPVYVAKTVKQYSDSFIRSLDILIACNGRVQAFKHDISAAFSMLKHVIPLNVLKAISSNGGPPAIGPNGEIEDAVAAFEQRVHMVTRNLNVSVNTDSWGLLTNYLDDVTTNICRQIITPERAFGVS